MIEYIREKLGTGELLCQLAEEASELAHAALKMRRVFDGTNPSPVTYDEALDNLEEEIADVKLLLHVLDLNNVNRKVRYTHIMQAKIRRWAKRLGMPELEDE